jgi:hypothetical protein
VPTKTENGLYCCDKDVSVKTSDSSSKNKPTKYIKVAVSETATLAACKLRNSSGSHRQISARIGRRAGFHIDVTYRFHITTFLNRKHKRDPRRQLLPIFLTLLEKLLKARKGSSSVNLNISSCV